MSCVDVLSFPFDIELSIFGAVFAMYRRGDNVPEHFRRFSE